MNLKQIEVFAAVAESGSFSRGADVCYITQSTASQHVAALEREFGVKLLDRTGKGACLTEAGKLLLSRAQRLVADARALGETMERFKGLDDVILKVGGSNIPGNYLIPAALSRVTSRHPGMKITMFQGDSQDIIDRIGREEVEIGVIGTFLDEEHDLVFHPLGRDDLWLTVAKQHKWQRRKSVDVDELAEERFILREPGSGTGKTVERALRAAGIDPRNLAVRAWLGSNEAVKHAVSAGLGASFLSFVSIEKEVERGELATVAVKGLEISRQFYLVHRAGRELSPAAAAFAEIMRQSM